jgi:protein CMS1
LNVARSILDTTSWNKDRNLENLPGFLQSMAKHDLLKTSKKPGRPHTLVVTGAGLRAADMTRSEDGNAKQASNKN